MPQVTDLARSLAKEFSPSSLIEIRDAAQRFAKLCEDAKDMPGARQFWAMVNGANAILDLGVGTIHERGLEALELFEHKEKYWEYTMDMAGDMGRREVAEQLIGNMTLADIAEDYEDMMQMWGED